MQPGKQGPRGPKDNPGLLGQFPGDEVAQRAEESQATQRWYLSRGQDSERCNEGLRTGLGKRGPGTYTVAAKLDVEERDNARPRVLASPHRLVVGAERLAGPRRYHMEGAVGGRGLGPYAEQGGGPRKAPEAAE